MCSEFVYSRVNEASRSPAAHYLERTMLRLSILLVLLTNPTRQARVADTQSLAERLGKLYEKLEKITVAPPEDKLYEKIGILNSLSLGKFYLSDEAEELLSTMQMWAKLSPEQLDEVVKDLQAMRDDPDDEKNDRLSDQEYGDSEWNDEVSTPLRFLSPNTLPSF